MTALSRFLSKYTTYGTVRSHFDQYKAEFPAASLLIKSLHILRTAGKGLRVRLCNNKTHAAYAKEKTYLYCFRNSRVTTSQFSNEAEWD